MNLRLFSFIYLFKNLKRLMIRDGICGVSIDALIAVAISNLPRVVSCALLAPMINFIQSTQ